MLDAFVERRHPREPSVHTALVRHGQLLIVCSVKVHVKVYTDHTVLSGTSKRNRTAEADVSCLLLVDLYGVEAKQEGKTL